MLASLRHYRPHEFIIETQPGEDNLRRDFGASLAEDIAVHGVRLPATGWVDDEGGPHLVDGHRRVAGVQEALERKLLAPDDPRAIVPFIVDHTLMPNQSDPKDLEPAIARTTTMLSFGTSGKHLTMSEKARGFDRLRGLGLSNEEIARRTKAGSSTHVADCLELLDTVDERILAAVDEGRCSATMAVDLARTVPDKAQQWAYFKDAMDRACTAEGEDHGDPEARVTARHLSIPIGKKAASEKGTVPFQGEGSENGVDHLGQIWKYEEIKLPFPKESRARGSVLLALRGDPELWRYGYELRWPGLTKMDGYVKVLPKLDGPGREDKDAARLACFQSIRGELESKDFKTGDRAAALLFLDQMISIMAGEGDDSSPSQAPSTSHDSAEDEDHEQDEDDVASSGSSQGAPTEDPTLDPPAPLCAGCGQRQSAALRFAAPHLCVECHAAPKSPATCAQQNPTPSNVLAFIQPEEPVLDSEGRTIIPEDVFSAIAEIRGEFLRMRVAELNTAGQVPDGNPEAALEDFDKGLAMLQRRFAKGEEARAIVDALRYATEEEALAHLITLRNQAPPIQITPAAAPSEEPPKSDTGLQPVMERTPATPPPEPPTPPAIEPPKPDPTPEPEPPATPNHTALLTLLEDAAANISDQDAEENRLEVVRALIPMLRENPSVYSHLIVGNPPGMGKADAQVVRDLRPILTAKPEDAATTRTKFFKYLMGITPKP